MKSTILNALNLKIEMHIFRREMGNQGLKISRGKYSSVFDTEGPLKPMKGGEMKIHLKPGPIYEIVFYRK